MDRRLVLEELARRKISTLNIPDIIDYNFQHQADFIKDPALKKALFCTRRSAKSYTAGIGLHQTALKYPGCNCLFIGLTRESAFNIIWKDILTVLNIKHQLGAQPNKSNLTMTHKNSSVIRVVGVDKDEEEMYKLLGGKFQLVVLDEASMYTINVRNLVDLVEPATIDQGGAIWLLGTASDFLRGIFYDVTTRKEKGWKLFEWTAHDNPYVAKQWQAKLDEIDRERPEYKQTPQYKQWYLNQWVIDEEKLVYRFKIDRNISKAVPIPLFHDGWSYVLGVDTGWEDDSAFVLTGYHINDPHLYVLRVYKQKRMSFDDVANKIQEFMRHPECAPHKIIIDGANKQGVESMRIRSSIPFEYADKLDKVTFIELCNSDLIQGKIKILDTSENRSLWEEMSSLVWVTDADKIKYPKKEHPNLANHLCDAFLYAWRCGYHYASIEPKKKVTLYSPDWFQQQSDEIWQREREQIERKQEWPEMGTLGDLG